MSTKAFSTRVAEELTCVSADRDHQSPINGTVQGTVPTWLSGVLFRNGPGVFEFGEHKYQHWFDGQALTHRFDIKAGQVSYSSAILQTEAFRRNKAADRIVVSEFGTLAVPDPCHSIFKRLLQRFVPSTDFTDNTMVNVFPRGDAVYAITESSYLNRLDPKTLDIIKRENVRDLVAVNLLTAHPHLDKGHYYNLATQFAGGPGYKIVHIGPECTQDGSMKSGEIVAEIPNRWRLNPSYSHSFAFTENYFVFVESPLVFNLLKVLCHQATQSSIEDCFDWWPAEPAILHVIDRKTGQHSSTRYTAPAFFTFHHINAYEEDDHIVMDVCGYANGEVIHFYRLSQLRDNTEASLDVPHSGEARRYVIPLHPDPAASPGDNLVRLPDSAATAKFSDDRETVECEHELLTDKHFDMPQIHYDGRNGRKYRYVYGIGTFKVPDQIVKTDVQRKESLVWSEKDCYPGEPVFVPSPDAREEDDGVVLSSAIHLSPNGEERHTILFILDAKTMTEMGRVVWPQVSHPRDVHGFFASGW